MLILANKTNCYLFWIQNRYCAACNCKEGQGCKAGKVKYNLLFILSNCNVFMSLNQFLSLYFDASYDLA